MEKMRFTDLNLSDEVLEAIGDMGFVAPSKIQEESIPELLAGWDVIGQAQTGTGKTLAFGSVLLSKIQPSSHIQAIVLSPTRELAMQIYEEFSRIGKHTKLNFTCVYGGSDIEKQIRTIRKGVDIVIGTPGRVMDLMRRKVLKLDALSFFVLDEADEMLNMGFVEDIETILQSVPEDRQTILFSATMPDGIKKIASHYMKEDYKHIRIKAKQQTATTVKQYYYVVQPRNKFEVLCRVLDSMEMESVIIFCKTKRSVDEITSALQGNRYNIESMHGDMTQQSRMNTLKRFKEGKVQFLVATDVAARGIDVESISHVINYELPQDEELYVHRIGRTGRAGSTGQAYSLVTPREMRYFRTIERKTNSHFIELAIPTVDDIFNQKMKELLFDVQEVIDSSKQEEFYDVVKEIPENMKDDVIAALLQMNYASRIGYDYSDDDMKANNKGGHFDRIFMNCGTMDKVNKANLINFLTKVGKCNKKDIGDICIKRKFTFVDLRKEVSGQIVKNCQKQKINSRKINMEFANER